MFSDINGDFFYNNSSISILYFTHYSRTIHAQYTYNTRTIPITSVMDDSELMKTFSSQNLHIRKFCCTFAPEIG